MSALEPKKKLVYAILEFLNDSIKDGTIRSDDQESMEVAMQCISESFSVEWSADSPNSSLSVKPSSLLSIFDVFLKTQQKIASTPVDSSSSRPAQSTSQTNKSGEAESLKAAGNQLVSQRQFSAAIEKYTEAIQLDPTNPVYYSNRAAAQSQLGAHNEAIDDALKALEVDPGFAKAYSRLGHGYFSSGQYEKAVEAYEKGLELEPDNATIRNSLATAKSKVKASSSLNTTGNPPGSSNSTRGAMPGMGGPGGMPDLASLMNNPMMAQMAQSLMANGGMERMMQNPMVQQMMSSLGGAGGGGGMPDLSQLMNDPAARELASSLMGGLGGGAPGAPGAGPNNQNPQP
ncbi:hypothetical protein PCANC_00611 [Puccinia coronata f. sp. avenae]|uniref:SGTA homodimerisation domain-containing protein n=1 Tax=Puccinia coronata f. sp. avenae TaxID=200324 RepID=A0A2N5VEB9_9BASI|nr:hypothetical protein PCASD_02859 [Puccinia coronata f. sp. avenae]PLW58470.1 hypothetical protein PCANC_00611 [Puccinia coronata f. sp. avenae]